MKIAVWDTYVVKKDGAVMHFDILVPDNIGATDTVFSYGRQYLASKGQDGQPLSARECRFCHIEQGTPDMIASIEAQGYHIIEMQGCN